MFSKIFKKAASPVSPASVPEKPAATTRLLAQNAAQAAAKAAWEGKLQAALGDDAALSALAKEAPLLDIKLAAVAALAGEEALKAAERELRTHNRHAHRAAKQRYEGLVAQRQTRAQAKALIETAAAMINEPLIPANRVVELDRAWQVLDAALLEDAQKGDFASLREQLATLLRARGDSVISVNRWLGEARHALECLNAACAGVAGGSTERAALSAALAAASEAAQAMLLVVPSTAPDGDAIAALSEALQSALQESAQIEARLAMLAVLQDAPAKDAESFNPVAAGLRWQALPALADTHIADALNARFEAWQRSKANECTARQAESRQQVREQSKAAQRARVDALTGAVPAAEAALTAGQLAEAGKHLVVIDGALRTGSAGASLQARIDALRAEYARLKDWQHWGGARVRENLVSEAEALASRSAGSDDAHATKLPIKQHAQDIEKLRERWKELDRLGGPTSQSLWQRFDTALKKAYVPVSVHLTQLKAARQENLEARKKLLVGLDALKLSDADRGESPNWREVARALEQFQTEWRKLGPVEHTVPHKVRDALLERMNASLARIENPLQEARRDAQSARENLIARALALTARAMDRDLVAKVRELQSEWQRHAKTLPLVRNVESALWVEFNATTDAVFTQRDAAFSARDAELKANQARREALIASLRDVNLDTPGAELKRRIVAVDAEWRKAGDVPKNEATKMDVEYRAAHDAALQLLASSAQRTWQATCNTLMTKLAFCEATKAGADSDVRVSWSALPALPPAWENALSAHFEAAVGNANTVAKASSESLNTILLQLESALEIASPAEFQSARRELKLRAMKNALESRQSVSINNTDVEELSTAALCHANTDALQRERLGAIVAALRSREPLFSRERGA
jgi:DNA repair protein SbcC/Rad50